MTRHCVLLGNVVVGHRSGAEAANELLAFLRQEHPDRAYVLEEREVGAGHTVAHAGCWATSEELEGVVSRAQEKTQ